VGILGDITYQCMIPLQQKDRWDKPLPRQSRLAEFNESLNYLEQDQRWDYYDYSNIMYHVRFVDQSCPAH